MSVDYEKVHELVIVGSGPAGYTAGVYAARAQLNPVLYEGSVTAGGALMNTTEVENFPGFKDGIMGPDLMDQMRKQASRFGAQLVTDDITEMKLDSDVKVLTDGSGNTIKARAVILAMGSAYKEIFFKEQVIAVVGGGDSAMEEANFLTKFAKKVVLIHRRDQLRASKIMAERAKANPKIEFLFNTEVIDVLGEDKVTGLKLRNVLTGEESSSDFTGLFVAIGHLPRSELVVGQVKTNPEGYVLVDSGSTRTNLPGVFASGDLVDFTYRQAITAAGSGCQAALDAERFLAGH
ncbi:MAG: thioredoxin-disulfide reductase [Actinobacteria bacterium]|nr:thioredoxin-disulfide reductase [Actinomycetota bacterium]